MFFGFNVINCTRIVSGKRIWIIEDDDNRLVKFLEVQQSWETSAEAPVPVHLQPVPVHPCRKAPVANLYRYTHVEKWQRATCTGTAPTCTGTPKLESTSSQPVPVQACESCKN